MADPGLLEAFNDCIDRMGAGQSINDCLRRYPQHAAALKPMLEVGQLVERTQAGTFEVATAQARVRARVVERLQVPARPRRRSFGTWVAVAASLMIASAAVFGAAESSLPGEPLYGVKRFTENVRGTVSGEQFGGRRRDEISVLLALRRAANVEFTGTIEQMDGARWTVAGLAVQVSAGTPGAESAIAGDEVRIEGRTTTDGELVAESVTILREGERPLPVTETPPPLNTAVPSPTITETLAPSATPTPTHTQTATLTATRTLTPTPTWTLTVSPSATMPMSPATCVPMSPSGWVRYTIQAGDTVVGLAASTGATVDQIMLANCLPETRMILVGQPLFLPRLPASGAALTAQPTSAPTQDDHGGDDDGGDDHGGGSGSSGSGGGDDGGGDSGGGSGHG